MMLLNSPRRIANVLLLCYNNNKRTVPDFFILPE